VTVASTRIDASCHPSWRRMHTSAAGDVGQANEHAIGFICGYAAAGRHMTVPSLKCSFLLGRSNPHRIRGSLSQHASVCQIAPRSVHSFVFFRTSLACPTRGPRRCIATSVAIARIPCYAGAIHFLMHRASATTRSTQPCIPPGSLNRLPASAGVRAGMSRLPDGG